VNVENIYKWYSTTLICDNMPYKQVTSTLKDVRLDPKNIFFWGEVANRIKTGEWKEATITLDNGEIYLRKRPLLFDTTTVKLDIDEEDLSKAYMSIIQKRKASLHKRLGPNNEFDLEQRVTSHGTINLFPGDKGYEENGENYTNYYALVPTFPEKLRKGRLEQLNGLKGFDHINEERFNKALIVAREAHKLGYSYNVKNFKCTKQVCMGVKYMTEENLTDFINEKVDFIEHHDLSKDKGLTETETLTTLVGREFTTLIKSRKDKFYPYAEHVLRTYAHLMKGLSKDTQITLEEKYSSYASHKLANAKDKFVSKLMEGGGRIKDWFSRLRTAEHERKEHIAKILTEKAQVRTGGDSCLLFYDPVCVLSEGTGPHETSHVDVLVEGESEPPVEQEA
jgi:hypothetical protein